MIAWSPQSTSAKVLVEATVFVLKQRWACVFGAAMPAVLFATRLWYPDGPALARNDAITLAAVGLQVLMVGFRPETLHGVRIIVLFHVVGTCMDLFKTSVGSYMIRVIRLFDLRFDRHPHRWATATLAGAISVNCSTHHYFCDPRWLRFAVVLSVFRRCWMHFRVFRLRLRMPLVPAFVPVAVFIWLAENIATCSNAWAYPPEPPARDRIEPANQGIAL